MNCMDTHVSACQVSILHVKQPKAMRVPCVTWSADVLRGQLIVLAAAAAASGQDEHMTPEALLLTCR
jgi:hypothetical protein